MTNDELCRMPASEMAGLIRKKKLSPVEVIDAVLDRIAKVDPKLNAFVTLTAEPARRHAKAAERALTRSPGNLERTPGGSRGGASAAAAAGFGPLHIGTDGGGSIRIPAAFAGVFGFKASYGRIPIYPVSGAWSLSHVGPLTRTVTDA